MMSREHYSFCNLNPINVVDFQGLYKFNRWGDFRRMALVLQRFDKLLEDKGVMESIMKYTGASKSQISQLFMPNEGPGIKLAKLIDAYGQYATKDLIFIDVAIA